MLQTTEQPTPTPAGPTDTIDLTTPPKAMLKREVKQEEIASPAPSEALQEQAAVPGFDDVPLAPRVRREPKRIRDQSPKPSLDESEALQGSLRRPVKKRAPQSHPDFVNVVEDEEYRTIIETPGGNGEGLVAVNCKFCDANCSIHTGDRRFFKGLGALRRHVSSSHRDSLPVGAKISATFILAHCVKLTALTPEEENAVRTHQHEVFVVAKKVGPGVEQRKKIKRSVPAATAPEEDEAQREMLEAFEDFD